MTLEEIEKVLALPSEYSGYMKKTAHVRFYPFSEMPRSVVQGMFRELKNRIAVLESKADSPTDTDRFLMFILQDLSGGS